MYKIVMLSAFLPTLALAQMPLGINAGNMANMEKQMQSMAAGMAQIEQCMSGVDQNKIEALGERSSKVEQEIAKLCQQGKRSSAQQKVIKFSREIKDHAELRKMEQCMAPMGNMFGSMPFENQYKDFESKKIHICD